MQCEVCGRIHRATRWRIAAGGFVVLCASCHALWEAMEHWEQSQRGVSLATFARTFHAYHSESRDDYLIPPKKTA
jgi:hypothetical protein